jgi:hypothetical protein
VVVANWGSFHRFCEPYGDKTLRVSCSWCESFSRERRGHGPPTHVLNFLFLGECSVGQTRLSAP